MATIEDLIVRLDADLKPFEAKLKRAERLVKDFAARAERELTRPMKQISRLVGTGSTASSRGDASRQTAAKVEVGSGKHTASQEVVFAATPAIKLLIDVALNMGTGVASSLIVDRLLSKDTDPVKELTGRPDFDPRRAEEAFFEFRAMAEDLEKAGENASAFDRLNLEDAARKSEEISDRLLDRLVGSIGEASHQLRKSLVGDVPGDIDFRPIEGAGLLAAQRELRDQGVSRIPTVAEKNLATLEEARRLGIEISESTQRAADRLEALLGAVDRAVSRTPDVTTQDRIDRSRAPDERQQSQTFQLEIPDGGGDPCACLRDLFNQFKNRGLGFGGEELQDASLPDDIDGVADHGLAGGAAERLAQLQELSDEMLRFAELQRQTTVDAAAFNEQLEATRGSLDALTTASETAEEAQSALADTLREADTALETASSGLERATQQSEAVGQRAAMVQGEVERVAEPIRELEILGDGMGRSLSGAFSDLITGAKDFDDILKTLEQQLLGVFERALFSQPGGLGGGFGNLITGGLQAVAGLLGAPTVPTFQHGGQVFGPGGPRGDRIPAMLSDGEFVVSAAATRRHRGLLEAINGGGLAGLVEGGLVAPRVPEVRLPRLQAAGAAAAGPANVTVNINGVQNPQQFRASLPQIRAALAEQLDRARRRDM